MSGEQWEGLIRAALLGTGRAALPKGGIPKPVARFVDAYVDNDPSVRLLLTAGVLGAYERAGRTGETTALSGVEPAGEERWPRASDAAGRRLNQMLRGQHREVLPEWLALANKAGRRVPEEYLPLLLQRGSALAELRQAIRRVLGRRGRWLAAHNPVWSFGAVPATYDDETADIEWATASQAARMSLFHDRYASDPSEAVTMLTSTWAQEKVSARLEFLAVIAAEPTMAAEALLENALDDKSGRVARLAAVALGHLVESRLAHRMAARMDDVIALVARRRLLGAARFGFRLEVTPPETFKAAARRDGLNIHGQFTGLGRRGWLLLQLVEATPLNYWADLGPSPLQWVQMARKSKWEGPLLAGWERAAIRQRDLGWALALLKEADAEAVSPFYLTQILPADERNKIVVAYLRQARSDADLRGPWTAVKELEEFDEPWSEAVAREILGWLHWYLNSKFRDEGPDYNYDDRTGLNLVGLRLPPALFEEAQAVVQPTIEADSAWRASLVGFLSLLEFRRDMHREFEL